MPKDEKIRRDVHLWSLLAIRQKMEREKIRRISDRDFAEALRVDSSTLSRVMTGDTKTPQLSLIYQIVESLGMPVSEFFKIGEELFEREHRENK